MMAEERAMTDETEILEADTGISWPELNTVTDDQTKSLKKTKETVMMAEERAMTDETEILEADTGISWPELNTVTDDQNNNYKIGNLIGKVGEELVFQAGHLALKVCPVSEDAKVDNIQEVVSIMKWNNNHTLWSQKLEGQIPQGRYVIENEIENVVGIKNWFQSGNFLCASLPLFKEGSLRYILTKKFPIGMPDEVIPIALLQIAKGVAALHEEDKVHSRVNCGLVFLSASPIRIHLAYGASCYYDNLEKAADSHSHPQESKESNPLWIWNDPIDKNVRNSTDIAGIGIIAIELFYGFLPGVQCTEDLKILRGCIRHLLTLPRRWQGMEYEMKKWKQGVACRQKMYVRARSPNRETDDNSLRNFTEFVQMCLAWDDKKGRPTRKLLKHPLLKNSKDLNYFEVAIFEPEDKMCYDGNGWKVFCWDEDLSFDGKGDLKLRVPKRINFYCKRIADRKGQLRHCGGADLSRGEVSVHWKERNVCSQTHTTTIHLGTEEEVLTGEHSLGWRQVNRGFHRLVSRTETFPLRIRAALDVPNAKSASKPKQTNDYSGKQENVPRQTRTNKNTRVLARTLFTP